MKQNCVHNRDTLCKRIQLTKYKVRTYMKVVEIKLKTCLNEAFFIFSRRKIINDKQACCIICENSVRKEAEECAAEVRLMENILQITKTELAVTKRTTDKAVGDVTKAEELKVQQDLYVDWLTDKVHTSQQQMLYYFGLGFQTIRL